MMRIFISDKLSPERNIENFSYEAYGQAYFYELNQQGQAATLITNMKQCL